MNDLIFNEIYNILIYGSIGLNRREIFSGLSIILGYLLFIMYATSLRMQFDFPVELYWFSYVFVSIPLINEVIYHRGDSRFRVLTLVAFSLMISLQYAAVDFSPILTSSDAVAEYRLSSLLIEEGHWDPFKQVTWYFGSEYRFYPVTNFIYSAFSIVSDLSLLSVVRYFFVIRAFLLPIFLYKFLTSYFDKEVSFLATIFFIASPGAIIFPHKESIALILFVLILYATSRVNHNRQMLFIALFSIVTLIMTHHFTSYVLLGILISQYLVAYIFKREKVNSITPQILMLFLIFFGIWILYIASSVFLSHQTLIFDVISGALLPGQVAISEVLSLNVPYEQTIILLGYAITLFSTGFGFLYYLLKQKHRSIGFLGISSFLILLVVFGIIYRIFGSEHYDVLVSHRTLEFGYIFVGVFAGLFFIKSIKKLVNFEQKRIMAVIVFVLLILVIIIGPMSGNMHPRTLERLGKVVSYNSISLNEWMKNYGASEEFTIGDRTIQLILTGYGDSSTVRLNEYYTGEDTRIPEYASYLATYKYMAEFYGTNLTAIYNNPNLNNIYTNGLINVYNINYHEKIK